MNAPFRGVSFYLEECALDRIRTGKIPGRMTRPKLVVSTVSTTRA